MIQEAGKDPDGRGGLIRISSYTLTHASVEIKKKE